MTMEGTKLVTQKIFEVHLTRRRANKFLSTLIMKFLSPAVTEVFFCASLKLPSFSLGTV